MKKILLLALAFAMACVVAGLRLIMPEGAQEAAAPIAKAPPSAQPTAAAEEASPTAVVEAAPAQVPESTTSSATTGPAPVAAPVAAAASLPKAAPQPAPAGPRPAKEPLRDPLAREALALVGMNPDAEEYWYAAINDPELSAHERQDLIEDLNEDGLSDPRHPAPEDLPLILNRLQIIEAAGPYAMDQVNADAFQEAYKDLVNLANRVFGLGEPVR